MVEVSNEEYIGEKLKPEMVLHCVDNKYFFTNTALETYCEKNEFLMSKPYTIEYYRNFAGHTDVIKINGEYYTAIDGCGYAVYNRDSNNWKLEYGNLRLEYQMIKDVGIELEDDVYQKIDKQKKYILKQIRDDKK